MRDPENVLNSLQEHSAQSGYVYDRLYRNLFNREFFLRAYQNIYASQGNMTAGTDGKTIDAMSLERIDRLIATLKDESYQPKPSRRTYIPKKNGKLRPLGIPSIDDKLVQEVVRKNLSGTSSPSKSSWPGLTNHKESSGKPSVKKLLQEIRREQTEKKAKKAKQQERRYPAPGHSHKKVKKQKGRTSI